MEEKKPVIILNLSTVKLEVSVPYRTWYGKKITT